MTSIGKVHALFATAQRRNSSLVTPTPTRTKLLLRISRQRLSYKIDVFQFISSSVGHRRAKNRGIWRFGDLLQVQQRHEALAVCGEGRRPGMTISSTAETKVLLPS